MDSTTPPPQYNTTAPATDNVTEDAVPPPQYTFPTSFAVGAKRTKGPLVTIPQIKGHLALLDAFANLKKEVEQWTDNIPNMPGDMDKRWGWFVNLAVERFDRWVRALTPKDALLPIEDVLPPLDIIMVWHSYMLNPRWYAEDCKRLLVCAPIRAIGRRFADSLARLPDLLAEPATPARVKFFTDRLILPFSPLASAPVLVNKLIPCPRCRRLIQVPYMTPSAEGYFQASFSTKCGSTLCQDLPITKETLGARKLAENLSRVGEAPDSCLPGAFFTNSQSADQRKSILIKDKFRQSHPNAVKKISTSGIDEGLCLAILQESEFSLADLRGKFGQEKLLGRIMSAHLEPMIYSVELVGAVLRQGSFVQKMHDFGWTRPGYFDAPDDEAALQHAVARYHAFLDLMESTLAGFFVPTLDIDLVWHTHQLLSAKYRSDCFTYIRRFIDHDDKIDGFQLSNAFDITCRAWKDRFGIQYTHCGCPLPGEKIGQRLSRFLSSQQTANSTLPISQLAPPNRPDSLIATHASEHNGVQFTACNDNSAKELVRRFAAHKTKQAKREAREAKEKEKKEKKKKEREEEERRGHPYYHEAAFLYAPPMFYAPDVAGCVAVHPGVVSHAGACGNANGQCGGGGCSSGGCGGGGCGGGDSGGYGGDSGGHGGDSGGCGGVGGGGGDSGGHGGDSGGHGGDSGGHGGDSGGCGGVGGGGGGDSGGHGGDSGGHGGGGGCGGGGCGGGGCGGGCGGG